MVARGGAIGRRQWRGPRITRLLRCCLAGSRRASQPAGRDGNLVGIVPCPFAPMPTVLSIKQLSKTYASGLQALKPVDLEIERVGIPVLIGHHQWSVGRRAEQ